MSEEVVQAYEVPEAWAGKRIDAFLASMNTRYSRSAVQKLITKQIVKINERTPKPSQLLKQGEVVYLQDHERPLFPKPESEQPLSILFEDDAILVVNKPAAMTVHPVGDDSTGTLVQAALFHSMQIAEAVYDINSIISRLRPGIVHRLDKNTTGVIVLAKTQAALKNLSAQFKEHTVRKEYQAIVFGAVLEPSTIHTNLKRKVSRRNMMGISQKPEEGREAITHLWPIERFFYAPTHQDVSLIGCRIETGRTHQIRVHCKYGNHPIIGDPLYSDKPTQKLSHALRVSRQMLHAASLTFRHPISNEECTFQAPLPEDMARLLTKLRAPGSLQ